MYLIVVLVALMLGVGVVIIWLLTLRACWIVDCLLFVLLFLFGVGLFACLGLCLLHVVVFVFVWIVFGLCFGWFVYDCGGFAFVYYSIRFIV